MRHPWCLSQVRKRPECILSHEDCWSNSLICAGMFRHVSDNKRVSWCSVMHKDKRISVETYLDWLDMAVF